MTSAGGWKAIRYTLRMANRVGWLPAVAGDAQPERLQDLRARAWAASWAAWATRPATSRRSARSRSRRWSPTCRAASRPSSSRATRIAAAANALAARAGVVRPARRRRSTPGRATRTTASIAWDEALERLADAAEGDAARAQLLLRQRPIVERGRLPAAALRARCSAPTTSTTAPTTAIRPAASASAPSLGTGTATVSSTTSSTADLFVLIGGNPASNHPRLMRSLMTIRRRGGQVIVVNPVKEVGLVNFRVPRDPRSLLFGSPIASLYVQPHIGGDIALLTGVAKDVLERGGRGPRVHRRSTPKGSTAFATPDRGDAVGATIETASGVDRADDRPRSPTCTWRRRTSSSAGRWASRTTCTASRTCRRSSTSRCCAAWSAGRTRACCRFAGTATCRAWARSASRRS